MEEKTSFVFDTNFIRQQIKLNEVVRNLDDKFSVYVTQVAIDERIAQESRKLRKKFDQIAEIQKGCSDIATIELKYSFEDIEKQKRLKMQNSYKAVFGTNIIPCITEQADFIELIERANQKIAPFSSEEGSSDKGFKDSLMWMSMLRFFKYNGDIKILFLTDDNGFQKYNKELCEEFKNFTGKTIEIKKNSYYKTLLKSETIVDDSKKQEKEKHEPEEQENLPAVVKFREEIRSVFENITVNTYITDFGEIVQKKMFSIYKKVDAVHMEMVFQNLNNILSRYFFDEVIPIVEVLALNECDMDYNVCIPNTSVEELATLHDKVETYYPNYIQQFYFTAANIINRNYIEKPVPLSEDNIPF